MTEETLIFPIDDSEPKTGFYAVVLKRKCPLRALGIFYAGGMKSVFLDGKLVSSPSIDWREAFGSLYFMTLLKGKKISRDEYIELVTLRQRDELGGVDVNTPTNRNSEKVAI